ncbi:UNVERIFIED_CONTAM: protein trichome birefringence-like 34 [Sesamum angustifolium]|uniref:Protein trichome birefringence-like 34 n=1 Tax=Sesamum angustifolium TaxID=2727405 RepID=A0AAW2N5D5_9LAMI
MGLKTWKNVVKFPHLASLVLLALVAVAIHLTRNKGNDAVQLENQVLLKEDSSKNYSAPGCNLFSGRWVYDNVSYPLYKERQCSFMEYDFACEISGRQDLKYQNWRWQPHLCDLPRFLK